MTEPSLPEESIFAQALEIASAPERAAFLDRACGNNQALRAEVEALLRAHDKSGDLLDLPDKLPATLDQPAHEGPGTRIGPYKLLQQIGEGGMGIVWMAEQEQPVRRKVALKIIKPGMDSKQVIARFEAERQALALMDHLNIARVLDGGATESGRPFFVMELIHGIPLTKYCDDNQLTPRERLELFVQVCQAIQHAHQKGVIHRDIKPSNVLVTLYDGKPVPKVIDFGVAKAVEQRLTERTLFTQYGTVIGTFEYMSPEQAEMSALGVDTRSDIYSLGVLLYELLTGSTPLERQRIRTAPYAEIVRMICEEEPPKPSTRLNHSETLPAVAAARKLEPVKLTKLVRGELDWIVMKALEKDRNRRYETANSLARDVERYLADEPVEAGPPSSAYRLRKLVRRHTQALAAAAGVLLGLLVLASTIGYFLYERRTRQNEAQSKQQQAVETALEKASELRQRGRWNEARVVLEQARDRLGEIGPADLHRRLAQASADLDLVDRLESIPLRLALPVDRGWFDTHTAQREYAAALRDADLGEEGEPAETVAAQIRASAVREQLVAALDDWAGLTQDARRQAWLLEVARRADPDPWRDRFRDPKVWRDRAALEALARELLHDQTLLAKQKPPLLMSLAKTLIAAKAETMPLLAAAQACYPDDFWLNLALGLAIRQTPGHQDYEAVPYYQAALALRPNSAVAHLNLADTLRASGQLDEAIREFHQYLSVDNKSATAHRNLGLALRDKGQLDEAIRAFRTALRLDPESALAHCDLGYTLYLNNQLDEALRECRAAVRLDANYPPAHNNLGHVLRARGQLDEAICEFRATLELQTHPWYHNDLGLALRDKNQLDEAIQEFRKAVKLNPKLAIAHDNLGNALYQKKQWDDAIREFHSAIALDPKYAPAHYDLGLALRAKDQLDKAIQEFRLAIQCDPKNAKYQYDLDLTLRAKEQAGPGHGSPAPRPCRPVPTMDRQIPEVD